MIALSGLLGIGVTLLLTGVVALDRFGAMPYPVARWAALLLYPASEFAFRWGDVPVFYTPYSSDSSVFAPKALLLSWAFWAGLIPTAILYGLVAYAMLSLHSWLTHVRA
jgi:hypothetical protein